MAGRVNICRNGWLWPREETEKTMMGKARRREEVEEEEEEREDEDEGG